MNDSVYNSAGDPGSGRSGSSFDFGSVLTNAANTVTSWAAQKYSAADLHARRARAGRATVRRFVAVQNWPTVARRCRRGHPRRCHRPQIRARLQVNLTIQEYAPATRFAATLSCDAVDGRRAFYFALWPLHFRTSRQTLS
jgi:hypothetical protein